MLCYQLEHEQIMGGCVWLFKQFYKIIAHTLSCFFSEFLPIVSWIKQTWNYFKICWNGKKGGQQTLEAKGEEK